MSCIITYKGKKYSEEKFLQYLNKQIAINNLFETNGDFASKIYEALGFDVAQLKEDIAVTNAFLTARQHEEAKRINSGEFDDTKLDLKTELQNIIDNSTNPLLVELAKSIQNKGSLKTIKAYSTQKPFKTKEGFEPAAAYQAETQKLVLFLGNTARFENKEREYQYLLHELVHHFVDRELVLTNSKQAENIRQLFKYTKYQLTKAGKENLYGLTNFHEFVTEALTNSDFQKELKSLQAPDQFLTKSFSIFDYFLELISKVLGTNKSVLEAVVSQAADIFELQEYKKSLSITPQQKQQAQQIYSQYIESLNKPNTNPILQGNQTINNPVYSAVFFNTNEVISRYKQVYPNLYSHHSTIQFKPSGISNLPIGETKNIKIVGRLTTDKVDVLIVDNPLSANKFPHITLSTAEGVKPFESNSEIEKNQDKIKPINDIIQGTIGVFDGKNEITTNVQQEQVKKFAELQERLNNKEFLEGAKFAYESSKGLQELGTQEEYTDYIARVSLGILKNPSSGEYNYTSKVKDIVYHGTTVNNLQSILEKGFSKDKQRRTGFHIGTKEAANNAIISIRPAENRRIIPIIINSKNLERINDTFNIDKEGDIEWENKIKSAKGDSFVYENNREDAGNDSYVVFEPEQIHILGSKQDIEGFKKFVEQPIQKEIKDKLIRTMTSEKKKLAEQGDLEAQREWIREEISEFYDALRGKNTDEIGEETIGLFRTAQQFPKVDNELNPYLTDIKNALNSFDYNEQFTKWKAKKESKNQAKDVTLESLKEFIDKIQEQPIVEETKQNIEEIEQKIQELTKPFVPVYVKPDIFKIARDYNMTQTGFFPAAVNPNLIRTAVRPLGLDVAQTSNKNGYYLTKNDRMFNPYKQATSKKPVDAKNYKGTGITKEQWEALSSKEKEVLLWQKRNCK